MTLDIRITVELQPSPQLLQLLQSWQPSGHKIRPQPGPSKLPVKPTIGDLEKLRPDPEQPEIKPQEAQEQPKSPAPKPHEPQKWDPLTEIDKFAISKGTTPEHVTVPGMSLHFEYMETDDRCLWIRYISGNVWTTWDVIQKLANSIPANQPSFGKVLESKDSGNRRTAVICMIRAVRAGLVAGQAKKLYEKMKGGAVTNSEFWTGQEKTQGDHVIPEDPEDPDAPFRQQLPEGMIPTNTRSIDGSKLEGSLED